VPLVQVLVVDYILRSERLCIQRRKPRRNSYNSRTSVPRVVDRHAEIEYRLKCPLFGDEADVANGNPRVESGRCVSLRFGDLERISVA
jgi:hypothetical protein